MVGKAGAFRNREGRSRWAADGLARSGLFLLGVLVIGTHAAAARASSSAATRAPEDRALGVERAEHSLVFEPIGDGDTGVRWALQSGEWALFGVEGLAAGSCSLELRTGGWGGVVSLGFVSSPVGRDLAWGGSLVAARSSRVAFTGGLTLETLALEGCRKVSALSSSVGAVVRFSPGLFVCSRVEGVRIAGPSRAGADVSLRVFVRPAGAVCVGAGIGVLRDGDVVCAVSSRVRLGGRLRAAVGYEEGSGAIDGALSLGVGGLVVEAGASVHPVLGVSKGFFLSWRPGGWQW